MKRWRSVQIRTAMLERIELLLSKNVDPTISNPTQFVDLALREKLEKMKRVQK